MKKGALTLAVALLCAAALSSCAAVPYRSEAMSVPDPNVPLEALTEPVADAYDGISQLPDNTRSYLYDLLTPAQRAHYDTLTGVLFKLLNSGGGEQIEAGENAVPVADAKRASAAFAWDYASLGDLITMYVVNLVSPDDDDLIVGVRYKATKYAALAVEEARTVITTADEVVKSVDAAAKSDVERLRGYAEWIIDHVTYPRDFYHRDNTTPWLWQAKGALLESEAVCVGYADAYDLICRRAGFKSVRVNVDSAEGVGHAWNMIELDGRWYHVDTTWMQNAYDANFLVSDAVARDNDHAAWWILEEGSDYALPAANDLSLCPAHFTDATAALDWVRGELARRMRTVTVVFDSEAQASAFGDRRGTNYTAPDGVTYYLRPFSSGKNGVIEAISPAPREWRTVTVRPRAVSSDFGDHERYTDAYTELSVYLPGGWAESTSGDYFCYFSAYGEYYPVFQVLQTVYAEGTDLDSAISIELQRNASGASFAGLPQGFYSSARRAEGTTDAGKRYILYSTSEGAGTFRAVAFVDLGDRFYAEINLRDTAGSGANARAALKSVRLTGAGY